MEQQIQPTRQGPTMDQRSSAPKVLIVTTVGESLFFFAEHVPFLKEGGFEVEVVSSPGRFLDEFTRLIRVRGYGIEMSRRISPVKDAVALWKLWKLMRNSHPQIVHANTPKAGLLGMVAAFLARVPVRIYQVHGLPFATAAGSRRFLLRWSDKVSCSLARLVLSVSDSVRELLVSDGLCPARKVKVLARGSVAGVDGRRRFDPERWGNQARLEIRARQRIPGDSLVLGFVGRLTRDKGMVELAEAWKLLREEFPSLHLLLMGRFEPGDPIHPQCAEVLREDPRVHRTGWVRHVAPLYAAMDVLALPSYREGLSTVLLEASCMKLAIVSTAVTGCTDVIQNGATGTLVEPADPSALVSAIRTYLLDPQLRERHGHAARARMLDCFSPEPIRRALRQQYEDLLSCVRLQRGFARKSQLRSGRRIALAKNFIEAPSIEKHSDRARKRAWLKRGFDVVAAGVALAVTSPIWLLIAVLIKLESDGPVFFRQTRAGLRGRPFTLMKFRTMSEDRDTAGNLLPDGRRLKLLGRFLRASSLDELPELINVLRGEMSLVGPRPLLMGYLPHYSGEQARRHEVPPGLTGWAQINGRNAISWEQKFALDLWYVEHQDPLLDLKILLRTPFKVLLRDGVRAKDHATMPEFYDTGAPS